MFLPINVLFLLLFQQCVQHVNEHALRVFASHD